MLMKQAPLFWLSLLLASCARPDPGDRVPDSKTAIHLVQKACDLPAEGMFHKPNRFTARYSDNIWQVSMWAYDCPIGSGNVNAKTAEVSGCEILVCNY
jgi:hypothetical protein